jgi:hypothetical protein
MTMQEMAQTPNDAKHIEVETRFNYHPPVQPGVMQRMETVRAQIKDLAHVIVDLVPSGREQAQVLTNLEDALMHANAGIARNQSQITQEKLA